MSTRVYRLLDPEPPREHDAVIRIAIAAMAADPTSPLSRAQRSWIVDLAHRTDRFTAHERAKLKGPLLAWVGTVMPRCLDIITKQFTEEGDSL